MTDVEIKRVKNTVYFLLRINNKQLNDELRDKYNDTLEEIIKEEYDYNEKDFYLIDSEDYSGVIGKKSLPIALKFYATIENNLKMLDKLKQAGYIFYTSGTKINLYALDKSFSSKFREDEYINLMTKNESVARRFYHSLVFESEEARDWLTLDFANIMHRNPNVTKSSRKNDDYNTYNNILTSRNIRFFGKDFLINLTEQQKITLDSLNIRLDDKHLSKVKELLIKYPNQVFHIAIRGDVLDKFSIDEIGTMSVKDAALYEFAMQIDQLDKMKEVLRINPNFDCMHKFVRYEIFKTLDASTIAGLTDIGIDELTRMKIPRNDSAYVIPIRKINRIVERDNKRKTKEEKDNKRFFKRK